MREVLKKSSVGEEAQERAKKHNEENADCRKVLGVFFSIGKKSQHEKLAFEIGRAHV